MSGCLFLLPYTSSWHGKWKLYLYIKNFPPMLPRAFLLLSVPLKSTVHSYNRVKRSAEVMVQRAIFFMARQLQWTQAYSSLRFRDQTQLTRYDSYGRAIGPSQRILPDNSQDSQQTDVHILWEIRTRNSNKREAADSSLRSRGHWDRLNK